MKETEIAWTDSTFNSWWGCAKVSEGCKNCYAETFSKRVGFRVWGQNAEHRRFGDKHWREPELWNAAAAKAGKRHRVFCSSMADVFEGRDEDDADRARLFSLIEATPHLDWLLLTKRPENMTRLAPTTWRASWPRNVWAGCTVENEAAAHQRIGELLCVPASVRFLSCEPLLEDVDLRPYLPPPRGTCSDGPCDHSLAHSHAAVSWVIVGGESGPGARVFDFRWARSIAEQCAAAGVPYFFKQAGSAPALSLEPGHGRSYDPPVKMRMWTQGLAQRLVYCFNDKKGGDVAELERVLPDFVEAGTFRREWPVTP